VDLWLDALTGRIATREDAAALRLARPMTLAELFTRQDARRRRQQRLRFTQRSLKRNQFCNFCCNISQSYTTSFGFQLAFCPVGITFCL